MMGTENMDKWSFLTPGILAAIQNNAFIYNYPTFHQIAAPPQFYVAARKYI